MVLTYIGSKKVDFTTDDGKNITGNRIYCIGRKRSDTNGYDTLCEYFCRDGIFKPSDFAIFDKVEIEFDVDVFTRGVKVCSIKKAVMH